MPAPSSRHRAQPSQPPLANAFIGHADPPSDTELTAALGLAKPAWDQLLDAFGREGIATAHLWKSHFPKWGWSLRVLKKKRTIAWLSPGRGGFNVLFILGDKAVTATRVAKLPRAIFTALDAAPRYPEGTGLRLVAKTPRDLPALQKLAAIKAAN